MIAAGLAGCGQQASSPSLGGRGYSSLSTWRRRTPGMGAWTSGLILHMTRGAPLINGPGQRCERQWGVAGRCKGPAYHLGRSCSFTAAGMCRTGGSACSEPPCRTTQPAPSHPPGSFQEFLSAVGRPPECRQGVVLSMDRAGTHHPSSGQAGFASSMGSSGSPEVWLVRLGTKVAQAKPTATPSEVRPACAGTSMPKLPGARGCPGSPGGTLSQCSCVIRGAQRSLPPSSDTEALNVNSPSSVPTPGLAPHPPESLLRALSVVWPPGCGRRGPLRAGWAWAVLT